LKEFNLRVNGLGKGMQINGHCQSLLFSLAGRITLGYITGI